MNRTEKIALLTKVMQGDAPAKRLQQVIENAPRSLILIDNFGSDTDQPTGDNDPVTFHDRGKQHRMSWAEANQYADRHRIGTFIILPAKQIT